MIEHLKPLFDCGCNKCLYQVADNLDEIAAEFRAVLEATPGGQLAGPHGEHPPLRILHSFSSAGLQQSADMFRELADRIERGG